MTVAGPVGRRVDVGTGVRHHAHLADGELGAGRVMTRRILEGEVVTAPGAGQPGVGCHLVLEDVTEIEPLHASHPGNSTGVIVGGRRNAGAWCHPMVTSHAVGDASRNVVTTSTTSVVRLSPKKCVVPGNTANCEVGTPTKSPLMSPPRNCRKRTACCKVVASQSPTVISVGAAIAWI